MGNRVQVVLSDEEFEDVQKRAGLIPLSAWFRALAFSGKKLTKRAVVSESLRASDPMSADRPDVEYGSDELPSGGSVARVENTRTRTERVIAEAGWRKGRKPLLKPKEKGRERT